MRGKFTLDGRKNCMTKKGYPLVIYLTSKNEKPKPIKTGYYSFKEHWNKDSQLPTKKHPNYSSLINYLSQKKVELSKLLEDSKLKSIPLSKAESILLGNNTDIFFEKCKENLRKDDIKLTALKSFNKYYDRYTYSQITSEVAKEYMKTITSVLVNGKPRKPSGIHTYMRSLTTLWNETSDSKNPFSKVRPTLVKTAQKRLTKEDLTRLFFTRTYCYNKFDGRSSVESLNEYRYYYMLLFYLGGIDMIDLANLRYDTHVKGDRIIFNRFKGGTNALINNKILPEAKEILQRFDSKPYLVPIHERVNYKGFLRRFNDGLKERTLDLQLTNHPLSKSARYSFINRARLLEIDERVTKEIVGHIESDTHSIYTDVYPEHVRDEAHRKIISLL